MVLFLTLLLLKLSASAGGLQKCWLDSNAPTFTMGNKTFCVIFLETKFIKKSTHEEITKYQQCAKYPSRLPLPKSMEDFKSFWNVLKTPSMYMDKKYNPDAHSPFYIDMADSAGILFMMLISPQKSCSRVLAGQ